MITTAGQRCRFFRLWPQQGFHRLWRYIISDLLVSNNSPMPSLFADCEARQELDVCEAGCAGASKHPCCLCSVLMNLLEQVPSRSNFLSNNVASGKFRVMTITCNCHTGNLLSWITSDHHENVLKRFHSSFRCFMTTALYRSAGHCEISRLVTGHVGYH